MKVVIIGPLNEDNYGYLMIDEATNEGIIVDVSNQPQSVFDAVVRENVTVKMVLTTHKHWDHAGGNDVIKTLIPGIEIVGSAQDTVEGCTKVVNDGDELFVGGIKVKCILTPGHTMGHVSYYAEQNDQHVCFTGDCLFIGGAGRFFEGSAADMYPTLYQKLGNLPRDTLIYCGHEYTVSNYRFALSVDGANTDLIAANERAKTLRDSGLPTIPTTLETEFRTNPFMRVHEAAIQMNMCGECTNADPIAVLAAVREAKNNFK
jgi:hydroxyacylglutathione hydrolase